MLTWHEHRLPSIICQACRRLNVNPAPAFLTSVTPALCLTSSAFLPRHSLNPHRLALRCSHFHGRTFHFIASCPESDTKLGEQKVVPPRRRSILSIRFGPLHPAPNQRCKVPRALRYHPFARDCPTSAFDFASTFATTRSRLSRTSALPTWPLFSRLSTEFVARLQHNIFCPSSLRSHAI